MLKARVAALKNDPDFSALRRSLEVYYEDGSRAAAMDGLYARFLKPGDLAFDIGSHVGDRIGSFRRAGARVVALEPQPLCAGVIRALYDDDAGVTLLEAACGAKSGTLTLRVNSANPTVSTASLDFIAASRNAAGWRGQTWDRSIIVGCTTLDELIARHGVPAFTKIDVEGFEDAVLAGLSHALPALSFEFTTIQRDVAMHCLERLEALGRYGFDLSLGESQRLTFNSPLTGTAMAAHLASLPEQANSGDVYCVLQC